MNEVRNIESNVNLNFKVQAIENGVRSQRKLSPGKSKKLFPVRPIGSRHHTQTDTCLGLAEHIGMVGICPNQLSTEN